MSDHHPSATTPKHRSRWSLGAIGLVVSVLLGTLAGPSGAVVFAASYLMLSGLWQAFRGDSWLAAYIGRSRLRGVATLLVATGLVIAVSALDPSPAAGHSGSSTASNQGPSATPTAPGARAAAVGASKGATATATPVSAPTGPGPEATSEATAAASSKVTAAPDPATDSVALHLLDTVAIKGRAPKTGYDRAQFGQAWYDLDHNGCDTRNDILRRDLVTVTLKPGTNGCVVLTGLLHDPYTGKDISFVRGPGTSNAVEIDHVVALADAWQKGAQQLSAAQRLAFANDPLNLLAVDGPTNQKKSDADAATWLPPNKSYRCAYVARQTAVKVKYGLWMTQAEHDAIARILSDCPDETVPDSTVGPLAQPVAASQPTQPAAPAPATQAPAPAPIPAPEPPAPAQPKATAPAPLAPPPPAAPAPADVYYANCAAVRAAGKAPLHRWDPGYRSGLDRDNDGIACE